MDRLLSRDLSPGQREKWAAVRVWACRKLPYLTHALLALDPVFLDQSHEAEPFDLTRMPADPAWRVYVDVDVLTRDGVSELGFWLAHHVAHLLRGHAARYPGEPIHIISTGLAQDQVRWLLATDAEINDDLAPGGLLLPEAAVAPDALALPAAMLAETYWELLAGSTPGGGDCGSCADGQQRGFDMQGEGLSITACDLLRRGTARRIKSQSREVSDVPEGWLRWADDVLQPTVDWRRELASAVRRSVGDAAGKVDISYKRISRRAQSAPDVILPSLRRPVPDVAVVVDSSGSITDQMLSQALAEVGGVLRSLGVGRDRVRVMACDARAYEAQAGARISKLRLFGGGGTDMCAGLRAAARLRPSPQLIIVMTDGLTPWPEERPKGQQVIVGLLDRAGTAPPWAEEVLIGQR